MDTQFRFFVIKVRQVPLIVGWRYTTDRFEVFGKVSLIVVLQITGKRSENIPSLIDASARFVDSEDPDKRLPGQADSRLA